MVPMLDKYSSLTIGLTLLTIGVLGLYETLHEGHAEAEPTAEQPSLAFSGAAVASMSSLQCADLIPWLSRGLAKA